MPHKAGSRPQVREPLGRGRALWAFLSADLVVVGMLGAAGMEAAEGHGRAGLRHTVCRLDLGSTPGVSRGAAKLIGLGVTVCLPSSCVWVPTLCSCDQDVVNFLGCMPEHE